MRPTRRSKMLGLALGERKALVAEVSSPAGGRTSVERVGEFVYPEGASLAAPADLGRALGRFLDERGFNARHVIVGIPGKWLLTKRVDAPPAEPQLVADTLRLQAEGEFASDGGEFVYDYAGESSTAQAKPVLLMAAAKKQIDQINEFASAARLKPAAVAPFAAALAARAGKDSRVLLFGPAGAEFVSQNGSYPRAIRYLGPSTSPTALLASELRRASAGAAMGAGAELSLHAKSTNGTPAGELLVWNDAGLEPSALRALGESLGQPVRLGDLKTLGATSESSGSPAPSSGYAAAVALAMAGMDPAPRGSRGALPVDFLNSRLAVVRQARVERRTVLISVAAAVVVLIAAAAIVSIRSDRAEVAALQKQVDDNAERVKAANASVSKMEFAQAWQSTDPLFVACLHDLTKSLPEDGQTFLTTFNLNEELKGGFGGKAKSDLEVLALLDRLQASGRFSDVKAWWDAPRGKGEATRGAGGAKPEGGTPTPPQPSPQPAMPTPPMPQPGGPMPQMPPGVNIDPDAMMPGGAVGPAAAMPNPGAMAMVMGPNGPMPMPAGAPPAGGPSPKGPRPSRGGAAPGPSGPQASPGGGPPAPGGGEVTFSMTFNYVPVKKK